MCPIGADFKHFRRAERRKFRSFRKVSSIMQAKVLSIMEADCGPVTPP